MCPTPYNTAGYHAALEAFFSDEPNPHGYSHDNGFARMTRALVAYEAAKEAFPVGEDAYGRTSQTLPPPGWATEIAVEHERRNP